MSFSSVDKTVTIYDAVSTSPLILIYQAALA